MTPSSLERYLREHIPLSKAMQVRVESVDEHAVVLSAPLAPNINHRDSVFGGSASALAILAAWSLLHTRMQREGIAGNVVLQRNTMEYGKPIFGEFTACSSLALAEDWSKFIRTLSRKGKARLSVNSILECAGEVVGSLTGKFVALSKQNP